MAIILDKTTAAWDDFSEPKFEYQDIISFNGKLLEAYLELSHSEELRFSDSEFRNFIKRIMAEGIAKGMIENNLIEFTTIEDPSTFQRKIFARCFLTKDDDVRMIRILKK